MTGVARLGIGIGLVGRRPEVSTLAAALDRARAGSPSGVLLSGDAGVGKSRLVAEAAALARAGGCTVLTGRCLDLAEVARGGTNRQVGATLFISEKTVSVHLSRVMAKLGASSRTEAVALAQARGVLPAPAVR